MRNFQATNSRHRTGPRTLLHYKCKSDADFNISPDILILQNPRITRNIFSDWIEVWSLQQTNSKIVQCPNPPRLRDCEQLPPCPRVQKIPKFFGSFEVLRRKTFVVISRLETRMSIRLMEIWNGFMEQYNSPAAGNLLLTILFPVHKLHSEQLVIQIDWS